MSHAWSTTAPGDAKCAACGATCVRDGQGRIVAYERPAPDGWEEYYRALRRGSVKVVA